MSNEFGFGGSSDGVFLNGAAGGWPADSANPTSTNGNNDAAFAADGSSFVTGSEQSQQLNGSSDESAISDSTPNSSRKRSRWGLTAEQVQPAAAPASSTDSGNTSMDTSGAEGETAADAEGDASKKRKR